MKKVIALVLCLVMALSLCAISSAATTTTSGTTETVSVAIDTKGATIHEATASGTSFANYATVSSISKTTVTGKIVNNVTYYVPNVYDVDGDKFIEVAESCAQYVLVNGTSYIYLAESDATYAAGTAVTVTYKAAASTLTCGDYYTSEAGASKAKGIAVYVDAKGYAHEVGAAGDALGYANGSFVFYDEAIYSTKVPHKFLETGITYKGTDAAGHSVPVSISCPCCGKTFTVAKATSVKATWIENVNFVTLENAVANAVYYTSAVTPGYIVVLDDGTATAASSSTVTSAKTFDAGIAMYVGMSIAAVTGSAVVIGKKKEF